MFTEIHRFEIPTNYMVRVIATDTECYFDIRKFYEGFPTRFGATLNYKEAQSIVDLWREGHYKIELSSVSVYIKNLRVELTKNDKPTMKIPLVIWKRIMLILGVLLPITELKSKNVKDIFANRLLAACLSDHFHSFLQIQLSDNTVPNAFKATVDSLLENPGKPLEIFKKRSSPIWS